MTEWTQTHSLTHQSEWVGEKERGEKEIAYVWRATREWLFCYDFLLIQKQIPLREYDPMWESINQVGIGKKTQEVQLDNV